MAESDRELRDRIEQLQAELASTRGKLERSEQSLTELTEQLSTAQRERERTVKELEKTRSDAADAQAAFEHAVKQVDRAKRQSRELAPVKKRPEPPEGPVRNLGITPDKGELRTRFVFGTLAGLIGGFFLFARTMTDFPTLGEVGLILAAGLVCGYLARQWGDHFWR